MRWMVFLVLAVYELLLGFYLNWGYLVLTRYVILKYYNRSDRSLAPAGMVIMYCNWSFIDQHSLLGIFEPTIVHCLVLGIILWLPMSCVVA